MNEVARQVFAGAAGVETRLLFDRERDQYALLYAGLVIAIPTNETLMLTRPHTR